MKQFRGRKLKKNRLKSIFFLVIFVTIASISLSYCSSFFKKEEVIEFLIQSTLFHDSNIQSKKSTSLLDFLLDYTIGKKKIEHFTLEEIEGAIDDPHPEENKSEKPIVYIYNTYIFYLFILYK